MKLSKEDKEDYLVFGISFLLHLAVLLCLTLYFVKNEVQQVAVSILSSPVEELDLNEHVTIQDIPTFSETETRIAPSESAQPDPVAVDSLIPEQAVTVADPALSSPQTDFPSDADVLARHLPEVVSKASGGGTAGEGLSSVGSAVDRLTAEIVRSATQKETQVVWLFDASLSLNAQRKQIAGRLEKILGELQADTELYPLRHVVCSFGKELTILIKDPTQDKEKIVRAIKEMALDESGEEQIFTAVGTLASDYKSTNRTRTMLIAFTDEVGDDQANMDRTIAVATRNGVSVYVVGTPAPFGMAKTRLKFVDPDERFDQSERWVEIEQGPESLFKMTLNISSLPIDSEPMDSGFGPYALSRLCASTGGIFFALHPNRIVGKAVGRRQIQPMATNIQHFFDGEVMKKYPPDLRVAGIQTKEAIANSAKNALIVACSADHVDVARELKTVFDSPNQGQFVTELAEGQKTVASLLRKVDPLYSTLQQGEKASESLKEPRWRASYFLAMGRVLAIKTRLDAYNSIAGDARAGLKAKNPKTNRWILEPSEDYALLNTTLKKQRDSAKKYLETVVKEFPDTPWALLAKKELEVPLAYRWVESRFEPVAMNPGGNANPPSAPEDDKKQMLSKPKPPRKLDKI